MKPAAKQSIYTKAIVYRSTCNKRTGRF